MLINYRSIFFSLAELYRVRVLTGSAGPRHEEPEHLIANLVLVHTALE